MQTRLQLEDERLQSFIRWTRKMLRYYHVWQPVKPVLTRFVFCLVWHKGRALLSSFIESLIDASSK